MTRAASALARSPDLLGLGASGLLLAALVALGETSLVRTALAAVYLLFTPGYVLMAALHPRRHSIEITHRIALSMALSLAIVPMITLALNYLPTGITLWSSLIAMGLVMLLLAAVAVLRRALLPREETFPPLRSNAARADASVPAVRITVGHMARPATVAVVSAAVVLGVLAVFGTFADGLGTAPEQFTQFYLLGPGGDARDYPRRAQVGDQIRVIVGVLNEEGRTYDYRVEVRQGEQLLTALSHADLPDGERWETPVIFAPAHPGPRERFDFELYRGDETEPLHTLHLLIEVVTPPGAWTRPTYATR